MSWPGDPQPAIAAGRSVVARPRSSQNISDEGSATMTGPEHYPPAKQFAGKARRVPRPGRRQQLLAPGQEFPGSCRPRARRRHRGGLPAGQPRMGRCRGKQAQRRGPEPGHDIRQAAAGHIHAGSLRPCRSSSRPSSPPLHRGPCRVRDCYGVVRASGIRKKSQRSAPSSGRSKTSRNSRGSKPSPPDRTAADRRASSLTTSARRAPTKRRC